MGAGRDLYEELVQRFELRTTFITMQGCIEYVCCSIGSLYEDDYDVEAIAKEVFDYDEERHMFALCVDESEYWDVVRKHDKTTRDEEPHSTLSIIAELDDLKAKQKAYDFSKKNDGIDIKHTCMNWKNRTVEYIYDVSADADCTSLAIFMAEMGMEGCGVSLEGAKVGE